MVNDKVSPEFEERQKKKLAEYREKKYKLLEEYTKAHKALMEHLHIEDRRALASIN